MEDVAEGLKDSVGLVTRKEGREVRAGCSRGPTRVRWRVDDNKEEEGMSFWFISEQQVQRLKVSRKY